VAGLLWALLALPALSAAGAETLQEQVVLAQLADAKEATQDLESPDQSEPSVAPSSADSEPVTAPAETNAAGASPQDSPSWLDTGHGFVTARADGLTQWFDSYFGGGDSEDTEASSRLRLRLIND